MNEKTKADYRKLAANFYKNHMLNEKTGEPFKLTPKGIEDALKSKAEAFSPEYWRRLRNALAFDQADQGYPTSGERINNTKNPLTGKNVPVMVKQLIKKKQRRVKSVKPEDLEQLVEAINEKGDEPCMAAMLIAKYLGCRPNEMMGVQVLENNQVFVPGSKKTADRGLDRTMVVSDEAHQEIAWAIRILKEEVPGKSGTMHKIQSRLTRLTKTLWPRRKFTANLYSFRHQLGSDLKASSMSRIEVAYIMGHQSTESVDAYGDKRRGSGGRQIAPGATNDEISQVVRENHKEAYSSQEKAQKPTKNYSSSFDM